MVQAVMNQPTRIQNGKVKCLILDAPSSDNLYSYLQEMLEFGVTDLVRTCEKTYDDSLLVNAGIRVHEMVFPDGEAPPDAIIREWLEVLNSVISRRTAVAVHCVAGLGRAPVLVAVALIEKTGLDPLDAIMYIRDRRKGAINRNQLIFLKNYRRRTDSGVCAGCSPAAACAIM
eukprot:GHVQ01020731.1.p1 GENE.GHVQ01020731.1~~GHVQ01020731.1.p1  ORF type:complete len:173 (+),score=13.76 GHVQ01020731.1:755-1273(+)